MILIIGGRGQGKLAFARTLPIWKEELKGEQIADGETDSLEAALVRPVIRNYHLYVKSCLSGGQSCDQFTEQIVKENPDAVVIADEIGSGIVPMDAFLREYRDKAGEMCQKLAKEADAVYRVVCGIGIRIK